MNFFLSSILILFFLQISFSSRGQHVIEKLAKKNKEKELIKSNSKSVKSPISIGSKVIYARIGMYELSLGGKKRINEVYALGVELDYRPRFKDVDNIRLRMSSLHKTYTGGRVKAVLDFFEYNGYNKYSISSSYRYLASGLIIDDEGLFSGSNSSNYSVYSQNNHEYALTGYINKQFERAPAISLYFGLGIVFRNIKRHYLEEGIFSNHYSVDYTTKFNTILPTVCFGVRFDVLVFDKKNAD